MVPSPRHLDKSRFRYLSQKDALGSRTNSTHMRKYILLSLILTGIFTLTGCNTVSDLVTSNIPDNHKGRASIAIRLREQEASLYRAKSRIAVSRISTGREGHNTPLGTFKVIRKDQDHRSSVYGYYADESGHPVKENIDVRKDRKPPGTHFIGASMPYFLEFSPGYGLHAGYLPGFPASHGCVRMPYWKARQFYKAARVGTTITVSQ
jgi:lipoprotein-anchoring transpeptidase ErfK/SrfK